MPALASELVARNIDLVVTAKQAKVDNPRTYFRVDNGKANYAAPQESSLWFQYRSIILPNGDDRHRCALALPRRVRRRHRRPHAQGPRSRSQRPIPGRPAMPPDLRRSAETSAHLALQIRSTIPG